MFGCRAGALLAGHQAWEVTVSIPGTGVTSGVTPVPRAWPRLLEWRIAVAALEGPSSSALACVTPRSSRCVTCFPIDPVLLGVTGNTRASPAAADRPTRSPTARPSSPEPPAPGPSQPARRVPRRGVEPSGSGRASFSLAVRSAAAFPTSAPGPPQRRRTPRLGGHGTFRCRLAAIRHDGARHARQEIAHGRGARPGPCRLREASPI